ncbi:exo-alpha-sialidase [Streptomyces sp. NPDC002994]|uniref:exo-alpha-sialidase n=1 Tax=Streptomyces sp. NPDC002994 TaxID=3154441 RepID=UPI0033A205CB
MRKPLTTVGALTAAVLIALAMLAGCSTTPDPPSEEASQPPKVPSGRDLPGWAHMVGLAADGSGFALLAKCVQDVERPENGFCRQYVAILDKGASQWRLRKAPLTEKSGTDGISADLRVLGPGRAWMRDWIEEDRHRTWFTADGGRTWQVRDVKRAGEVRSIPKGAALSTLCGPPTAPDGLECPKDRLMVMSPDDGRLRQLNANPPLAGRLHPATYAEPDGSWWVSGQDPSSGAPAVAVSRDAGRTWTTSMLDSPVKKPGWGVRVSVGDGVVYAAEMGELPAGEPVKNPVRAIHRSRDGGRTWERTWTTGREREPRTLAGVLVPGKGDALRLHAESGTFTSPDGGRTFHRTGRGPGLGHASTVPLGRLVTAGACGHRISADGERWTTFTVGTCEN